MRRTPVRDNASSSRTLASVGMGSSFWRPSRGPTSRMLTESGSCAIRFTSLQSSVTPRWRQRIRETMPVS